MGSMQNYLTTNEAADYLDTSIGVIYYYVRVGKLKRVPRTPGTTGRARYLFLEEDVQAIYNKKIEHSVTHDEALVRAVRAEAISRDTERRIGHLYEMLGFEYDVQDLSEESLRTQYKTTVDLSDINSPPITPEEAVDLARCAYRMNEEHLRLLRIFTKDKTPWEAYLQAIDSALYAMRELGSCESSAITTYLLAAARNVRHVAFEFARTAYGHVQAEKLIVGSPEEVDASLAAILMSMTKRGC